MRWTHLQVNDKEAFVRHGSGTRYGITGLAPGFIGSTKINGQPREPNTKPLHLKLADTRDCNHGVIIVCVAVRAASPLVYSFTKGR